jgi:hypothetical protein
MGANVHDEKLTDIETPEEKAANKHAETKENSKQ